MRTASRRRPGSIALDCTCGRHIAWTRLVRGQRVDVERQQLRWVSWLDEHVAAMWAAELGGGALPAWCDCGVWWHAEYTTPELTAAIADCAGRRLRLQPRLDGEDLELRRWKWRQFHDLCEQVAPGGTFAELLPDPRFGREWIRLGVLAARYAGGPGKVRPGGAPGLYAMTFDVPPPGALWRLPLDGADSQQRRDRYSAEHWDRVERELGERYANEPVRLARYRERHDDETAWLRAALEDFERRRDGARR